MTFFYFLLDISLFSIISLIPCYFWPNEPKNVLETAQIQYWRALEYISPAPTSALPKALCAWVWLQITTFLPARGADRAQSAKIDVHRLCFLIHPAYKSQQSGEWKCENEEVLDGWALHPKTRQTFTVNLSTLEAQRAPRSSQLGLLFNTPHALPIYSPQSPQQLQPLTTNLSPN